MLIAEPVLPGDFDLDGDVDGRDFLVWQRNTSVGDLADWQANYGVEMLAEVEDSPSRLPSVPEPSTLLVLGLGSLAMRMGRFWRCSRLGTPTAAEAASPAYFVCGLESSVAVCLIENPNFSPATKITRATAPAKNQVSPSTRIHRRFCITGSCRNSELRAYQ